MRNKTVQELIEHHLRASGPCTFESVKRYLVEHSTGTTDSNGTLATHMVLDCMVEDCKVSNDGGVYEWNYGDRTAPLVKRRGFQGEPIFLKA
jgi:hypothetical protein